MITDSSYSEWNIQKIELSKIYKEYKFKEGDIWWVSVGVNLGSESFGKGSTFKRPVLVIKKLSKSTCIVCPMTTKIKQGSWFIDVTFQNETNYVLLYQIKMMDTKRFQRRLASLDTFDFARVKEKLALLLDFNYHPDESGISGNSQK